MINTIKNLPRTFYSPKFYNALRPGKGIGYTFLIVIFLLGFVSGALRVQNVIKGLAAELKNAAGQMPETTVKDHKLSIDKPAPFTIDLFKTDKTPVRLTIDPAYKIDRLDKVVDYMEEKKIFVLVTADKIAARGGMEKGRFEVRDLDLTDGKFTHEDWVKVGEKLSGWMYPVVLIALAIALFIWTNVCVFLMALVTLFLAMIMKVDLDLSFAMRISAAAGIPIAVLCFVLPLPGLIAFFVWLGYMVFAVSSIRKGNVRIEVSR